MGAFGFWQWLVVLLIVVLIFGTSKLKNIGKDLGSAVKGFKEGLHEEEKYKLTESTKSDNQTSSEENTIDVETKNKS